MASTSRATRVPAASASPVRRRAREGSRGLLVVATVLVVLGSFAPWVDTAVGSVSGMRGGGTWTFYAAMLGVAGIMVVSARLAAVQAAVLAVTAVALPVWQLVHAYDLVGFEGWVPGAGLVLVPIGGIAAGVAAYRLARVPRG